MPCQVPLCCDTFLDFLFLSSVHGLQQARLLCPSRTPRACSNSKLVIQSNHLLFFCPRMLLHSIFPSTRVFSNEWVLRITRISNTLVAKILEFQLQYQFFNEYSGLSSFRNDWLGALVVHGTLKNLLKHHSSKASILQRSAFFIIQLSHPYNGNPLQYSCLENPRDRGAWWAAVYGVARIQPRLKRLTSNSRTSIYDYWKNLSFD